MKETERRDSVSPATAAFPFSCGVYRGINCEIVETEQFALLISCSSDKNILGAKLYKGSETQKHLVAVCERNSTEGKTKFAYYAEDDVPHTVVTNSELATELGTAWDSTAQNSMRRIESFFVDHSGAPLPTVKEAGIQKCLAVWRMGDSYCAVHDNFYFYLCTGRTEYIFSIQEQDTNIYCGASYNIALDFGLFGGGQFFRIRNYQDNREKWCGFHCDFSYDPGEIELPSTPCAPGTCMQTSMGLLWGVKRCNDDEIVLQGCGEDEYTYRRAEDRSEQFTVI